MLSHTSKDIGLKSSSLLKNASGVLSVILNSIPSPIAIWSGDRRWWTLNLAATRLTGFSGEDFQRNPTLWIEHVHPQDRANLLAAWDRLRDGEKEVSSEYRFFPKQSQSEIWLRDVSESCPVLVEETRAICSAYAHLPGLDGRKQTYSEEAKPRHPAEKLIRELTHAIQNSLQTIIGEIEILNLPATAPSEYSVILNEVGEIDKFLRQANEYFSPVRTPFSNVDPLVVLRDLQREAGKNLADHGIRVSMVCKDTLPEVFVHPKEFCHAVRQVIDFSLVLLPNGGEVLLDAGQKTINGKEFVELSVTSNSESSLACEEKDVFQPFVRVNDQRVGLSMAIAQEILRRQHGEITFRKASRHRGVFTILMEVTSH
jgi:nitrogen-specific signal transduction histidine kinase